MALPPPPRDATKASPRDRAAYDQKIFEDATPVAVIVAYAGTTAPFGWLLCYGQAVSRDTYHLLFKTIGTTFGVGDGSTTFNVPDLRGRVIIGLDNLGGSSANRATDTEADSLGGAAGSESAGAAHTHTLVHTHTAGEGTLVDNDLALSTVQVRGVQTTGDVTSAASTSTTSSSGTASGNMPPYMALAYIIKH